MTWVCLTSYSGPVRLPRHHGGSTPAVTVPVVSALSVAATVATDPTVVVTAQTEVFALLAVAAPLLVASVELPPARMTAASGTTTAVTATGQGAPLTATAR
jgi:hypothetical protein